MINAGDVVQIKKEWQDAGDDEFTWVAISNEEKGRVDITPIELENVLRFPPVYTVRVDMLV